MARKDSHVAIRDEGIEWLHSNKVITTKTAVLLKLLRWPHALADGSVWVSEGVRAIANDLGVSENTVNVCIRRLKKSGALKTRKNGRNASAAEYYVRPGILVVGTRSTTKPRGSWYKTPPPASTGSTTLKNNGGAPLEAGPTERHTGEENHEGPIEAALRNHRHEGHEPDTSSHGTERAGRQAQTAPDAAAHSQREDGHG